MSSVLNVDMLTAADGKAEVVRLAERDADGMADGRCAPGTHGAAHDDDPAAEWWSDAVLSSCQGAPEDFPLALESRLALGAF